MTEKQIVPFEIIRAKCGWRGRDLLVIARPDRTWSFEDYASDPYYPFSIYLAYQPYLPKAWGEDPYDMYLTDINFISRPGVPYKRCCFLSVEGEFLIREDPEDKIEKIKGAGIEDEDGRGRLYGMTIINDEVYTYGEARQLYHRSKDGIWNMLDTSIFQPTQETPMQSMAIIYDVKGLSNDALYIIDSSGSIFFWNGKTMQLIQKISGISLVSIVVEDENTVWIGGSGCTLLKGNHKQGFQEVIAQDQKGKHNFVSMSLFQDKLYLASHGGGWDVGAYVYENGKLTKLVTGLLPETEYDAHTITSTNEDLWIVGIKDILHFDSEKWERIDFPKNPPIR